LNIRDLISSTVFYVGVVVVSLVLIRVGTRYGFDKVHEDFREMEPGLQRGTHLFVDRSIRQPEQLNYGDIIAYLRPPWKRAAYKYEFGRVVGKPGDVVEMQSSKLLRADRRDGELELPRAVSEPYVDLRDRPADFSPFVIPRNTILVFYDSRARREPLRNLLIPVRSIYGRAIR